VASEAKRQVAGAAEGDQQPLAWITIEDERAQEQEGRRKVGQPRFGAAELQRAQDTDQQPEGAQHRHLVARTGPAHPIGTSILVEY
jgi:hypothetical protein